MKRVQQLLAKTCQLLRTATGHCFQSQSTGNCSFYTPTRLAGGLSLTEEKKIDDDWLLPLEQAPSVLLCFPPFASMGHVGGGWKSKLQHTQVGK